MPSRSGLAAVLDLLDLQSGVVARFQVLDAALTDNDIERLVRRRDLSVAHRGVYLAHTGTPTYLQREWIAVLAAWPAALCGESALPGHRPRRIEVAVEHGRTLKAPTGARVVRVVGLAQRVRPTHPPRVRVEHALIDVMTRHLTNGDVAAAFAALARVCFGGRTTPDRVRATLATRARVSGRRMIEAMLDDLAAGACSVLERGYLLEVERAHGLPRGSRQSRSTASGRPTAQDVRYDAQGVIVELDGRSFHDTPEAYDRDAERDLAEKAACGAETVRVTYGLVFGTPCRTAEQVGRILQRRGWSGAPTRCERCAEPGRSAA